MLHLATEGRVRIITMDRAGARNAVDPAQARALFDAFVAFDADPDVDVAVLTGAGGTFCAGFDLKSAAGGEGMAWIDGLTPPEAWIDARAQPIIGPMGPSRLMLAKPVIAAIEGWAAAGGMELALWADMRVMGAGARMGVLCRRWGVPLIDGGTVRLPRVVGQGRANDLILTGREVAATEALSMGLADRVVPQGAALAEAVALAQGLCAHPQGCMRADFLSARLPGDELARAIKREWASVVWARAEGVNGAQRFADGAGRGGRARA